MIQNESMTCVILAGVGLHAPYYPGSCDLVAPMSSTTLLLDTIRSTCIWLDVLGKAPMYPRYVTLHAY